MTTILEKFLTLRKAAPFHWMSDAELTTLSTMVRERDFPPGAIVCENGKPLEMLYLVVSGEVQRASGEIVPECFGAASLLFGLPVSERLVACAKNGARCLVIRRPHFFTIVRQFPTFLEFWLTMPTERLEVASERRDR